MGPTVLDGHDDPEKDDGADGRLRVVYDMGNFGKNTKLTLSSPYNTVSYNLTESGVAASNYSKIDTGIYQIMMDDSKLGNITVSQGGVYSLIVAKDPQTNIHRSLVHTLTPPNSIHILWLFPQYFVITVGEIMFSVIIVAEAKAFDSRASEFFMFAILMLVDMAIFMWLAWRYTPRYVRPDREEGMQLKNGVNGVANKNFKNDES